MKKIYAVAAVMLFLAVGSALAEESKFYARSFNIEKVYFHNKGYKVTYITGKLKFASTYLPHSWFSQSSTKNGVQAKGELAYGNDASYPYMTIFWKDGKFSHVRLYLKKNLYDVSYGAINPNQDPTAFDVEEPALEY
ncbi:MAG: hypothetical protein FWG35_03280 [Spirochaetaceae bacterium]|nr:hypothetical protein [Spirochaetaceae bacterium]